MRKSEIRPNLNGQQSIFGEVSEIIYLLTNSQTIRLTESKILDGTHISVLAICYLFGICDCNITC